MSSRIFLVVCEDCPPYEPISASAVDTMATRSTDRRGSAEVSAVNPVTEYTDNMWCRRGPTITPGEVRTKGVRANGIED